LAILYSRQTEQEKVLQHTNEENHRGFSQADSEILTSFAQRLQAGGWLTDKQRSVATKHLPRYAGQVWEEHLARLNEQDRNAAISASHADQLAEARQKRRLRKQIVAQAEADQAQECRAERAYAYAEEHPTIYRPYGVGSMFGN
jgi:hypothetical protein